MSARAELISMVNDIRLDFDRGQGTLGEVADRTLEICRRVIEEEGAEVTKLSEVIDDLATHGLRYDLNPTLNASGIEGVYGFFIDYIKRMDNDARLIGQRLKLLLGPQR